MATPSGVRYSDALLRAGSLPEASHQAHSLPSSNSPEPPHLWHGSSRSWWSSRSSHSSLSQATLVVAVGLVQVPDEVKTCVLLAALAGGTWLPVPAGRNCAPFVPAGAKPSS